MLVDIILLLLVGFFMVLAARSVIADHRRGIPSCGYACGQACSGSCSLAKTGRLPNGKKISRREMRKIRKVIKLVEETTKNGTGKS